jgi:hypothetical protein
LDDWTIEIILVDVRHLASWKKIKSCVCRNARLRKLMLIENARDGKCSDVALGYNKNVDR